MYKKHWGLSRAPFEAGTDPAGFYSSPTHEEALSRLNFLVEHQRHLGILSGASGTGKTLLLEVFAEHWRQHGAHVASLSLLGLAPDEFVWKLAAELGLAPDERSTTFGLWRRISDRIAEHRYQQLDTIVILDDANQADPATMPHVTRLAKTDRSPEPRLRLFLSTCPDGLRRLGWSLLEMAELRIELPTWEPEETAEFVAETLRAAGRKDAAFDEAAIARLHACADGIPRRVCQIAQLALLAGAGQKLSRIDAETVDAVVEELGVIEAPSASTGPATKTPTAANPPVPTMPATGTWSSSPATT